VYKRFSKDGCAGGELRIDRDRVRASADQDPARYHRRRLHIRGRAACASSPDCPRNRRRRHATWRRRFDPVGRSV